MSDMTAEQREEEVYYLFGLAYYHVHRQWPPVELYAQDQQAYVVGYLSGYQSTDSIANAWGFSQTQLDTIHDWIEYHKLPWTMPKESRHDQMRGARIRAVAYLQTTNWLDFTTSQLESIVAAVIAATATEGKSHISQGETDE